MAGAPAVLAILGIFGFLLVLALIIYRLVFAVKRTEFSSRQTVPVCPRCGEIAEKGSDNFSEVFDPSRHKCTNCGFEGVFLDIIPEKIAEFRRHISKKDPGTKTDYESDFVLSSHKD